MAKVHSRYNPEFIKYLKSIGGKWNPEARVWTVPDGKIHEAEAKAKELNVENLKIESEKSAPKQAEDTIPMRLSRDGRFVLISATLMAFTEDVKAMFEGKRRAVKFRVLPPKQP